MKRLMSTVITSGFSLSVSVRCLDRAVNCNVFNIATRGLKSHFHLKLLPLSQQRKTWSAIETLQLVSKSSGFTSSKSNNQTVLELCQRLPDLGYEFNDIASQWDKVASYNIWQITWASHNLLVEWEKLTSENLLETLQKPILPFTGDKELQSQMTREQCIAVFTDMLLTSGATESSVHELKEKFLNYEIPDSLFVSECSYAVSVSRLLVAYLKTSPDTIISEYNCVLQMDFPLFVEQWKDMLSFGLRTPCEVVNYSVGSYMKPALRAAKSYSTRDVLKLVGLTKNEADAIGFTKQAILSILHTLNMQTIESTYDYLLDSDYSRHDIAQVPFILAFARRQIEDLLDEKPEEFKKLIVKTEMLNFISKSLDKVYGSKIAKARWK